MTDLFATSASLTLNEGISPDPWGSGETMENNLFGTALPCQERQKISP